MMQKISSFIIDLIDISSSIKEFLDFLILSSYQSIFQSKKTTVIHLINISTHIKHSVCKIKELNIIEIQERSSSFIIWIIDTDFQINKFIEKRLVHYVIYNLIFFAQQIERCGLIIIRFIRANLLLQ